MGQVNQVTPDGSLTYTNSGNHSWTDPSTGQTYSVPQYTATTTLSPEAQAIRDQNNSASLNLATLAANQSGRADQLLSTPMDTAGLPAGADRSGWNPAQYGGSLTAPQFSQGGAPLPGMSQGASVPGASQATAGPQFGNVGTSAGLQDSYTPEGGFSADRQRVEDALMGRLGTQRDRDMERLRTQLTNQGVNIGSEAYSRAMQDFDRTNTDMRTSAILASGQEQSRLLGEARGAGEFTNNARQTEFGNQITGTGFNNANNMQAFQIAEDQRRYGDQFGLTRFGMEEDQRRYDDSQRLGLFGLGEDMRRYGDSMQQQGFANNQAIQGRSDAIADANFGQQGAIFDAQDNARMRELQTQLALRNQPINEITALMSGSQVATPQFGIAQPSQIPTTDFAGIQQQGFNNQMANYQTRMNQYGQVMGGLFGLGSAGILASDVRLKTDIEPAGQRGGHDWYRFRYVWDEPGTQREGVMAQEVIQTRPDAVITHPLGFLMVDYDKLGV
jgi:hypothetical protein